MDNDCDGEVDGESAIGFASYYVDSDGDGYDDDDTEIGAVRPRVAMWLRAATAMIRRGLQSRSH